MSFRACDKYIVKKGSFRISKATVIVMSEGMMLLISIVDRGIGEHIASVLSDSGVTCSLIFLGKGTANSDMLDYLGLGETAKDIVFSTLPSGASKDTLRLLTEKFNLDKPGTGIAFTVPMNSIGGKSSLKILSGKYFEEEQHE